jgi:3-deoxy-D-manno-octulosonic-acid transferase
MLFAIVYFLISLLIFVLLLIPILLISQKSKYKDSLPARFFLKNNSSFNNSLIHFHACSLGEVKALKPIINILKQDVNISTITDTGMNEAQKLTSNVRFLPYEIYLPFWIKRRDFVVVLEAELWFMLFFIAKLKGSTTLLLNARISDRSYKRYKRFSFFYKIVFSYIDHVFAQSSKDAQRLQELGAKSVDVIGNIKVFQEIKVTKRYTKPNKKLITIASSHDKEELLLLNNIKNIEKYKIIIAPRHPDRFKKVAQELESDGYSYQKFSIDSSFNSNIILMDIMGELINIYAISDIVLLGGSFVPNIGGHNPLECAYFNTKIVSGTYYFNQKSLYEIVQNIEICQDIDRLQESIDRSKPTTYSKDIDFEPICKFLKGDNSTKSYL